MKLLFDEQLSPQLVGRLADLFPDSLHVHFVGLGSSGDPDVWMHARDHDLVIVTKDSDFSDLAVTRGAPPKVLWLRLGNCRTAAVEALIRSHAQAVREFGQDPDSSVMVLVAADAQG